MFVTIQPERVLADASTRAYVVVKPSIQNFREPSTPIGGDRAPVASLRLPVCYSASAWSKQATISTFHIGKVNF